MRLNILIVFDRMAEMRVVNTMGTHVVPYIFPLNIYYEAHTARKPETTSRGIMVQREIPYLMELSTLEQCAKYLSIKREVMQYSRLITLYRNTDGNYTENVFALKNSVDADVYKTAANAFEQFPPIYTGSM